MRYMFTAYINLEYLDLLPFDTSNVKDMEGMFGQYDNISCFDLSSIDSSKPPPKDFSKKYY